VINNIQTYQKHRYSLTVVAPLRNYLMTQSMLTLVHLPLPFVVGSFIFCLSATISSMTGPILCIVTFPRTTQGDQLHREQPDTQILSSFHARPKGILPNSLRFRFKLQLNHTTQQQSNHCTTFFFCDQAIGCFRRTGRSPPRFTNTFLAPFNLASRHTNSQFVSQSVCLLNTKNSK